MLDLIKLKEQIESYPPGPWCEDVKTLAAENEIFRGENHALQVEVERLRGDLDDAEARIERLLGALEAHQYYVAEIERLRALIIAHRDECNCDETQLETPPRQCDVCFALYAAVEDA